MARCPHCGLIFVPAGLARTQDGVSVYEASRPVFLSDGNEGYYLDDDANLHAARCKLEWMAPFVEPGSRILDIGSGFGHFLFLAGGRYRATGLELAPSAAAAATGRFGVSCAIGSIHSIPDVLQLPYDAATGWDLIEHLDDPVGALQALRGLIRPGGTLLLSTPDAGSFVARAMGRHWHYLDPVQHVVLFTRKNLAQLLDTHGFEALAWRSFGRRYRLRYVLDRLHYLNRGVLRHGIGAVRLLVRPLLERSIYLHLGDVLSVAARRRA